MYRTAVTIFTAQRSIYVPHSGNDMYRTAVNICTVQRSLYVPHSGHYMYHKWSLYVPHSGHYVPHSGHYMYHQYNIHNSTFGPHTVFMCFVWISEQTAIISLYNINWLVCIIETECVYCAVRTGSLYILRFHFTLESGVRTSQPVSVLCFVSLLPADWVWSVCLPRSGLSKADGVRGSLQLRGACLSIFVGKSAPSAISACYTWHRMECRETFSSISRKHVTVVERLRDGFIVNWPLSWCVCPPNAVSRLSVVFIGVLIDFCIFILFYFVLFSW